MKKSMMASKIISKMHPSCRALFSVQPLHDGHIVTGCTAWLCFVLITIDAFQQPNRTYYLEDVERKSIAWVDTINHMLKLQKK
eukprot:m.218840 g.218840  ORF g.218840 m.218840 type:complete len:83 (+) comp16994_c4_seq7:168-416(+)